MSTLLPLDKYNRVVLAVTNGLENQELCSAWDIEFLTGFVEKIEKYKRHMLISDSQWEQFDRIEDYLREELGTDYDG